MVNIGGVVSGGVVVGGTVYNDNQAGVDVNPAIGIMDIGTFLNSISVNFVVQGFGVTSASPIPSLTMNSNGTVNSAAILPLGLDILITDNNFSMPPTPLFLSQTVNLLSSVGGPTANATAVGYYGDTNITLMWMVVQRATQRRL